MTPEERRPAFAMIGLGVLLAVLALLPSDRRIGIVLWLIAIPMVASGSIAIAWGNATREFKRLRSGRD